MGFMSYNEYIDQAENEIAAAQLLFEKQFYPYLKPNSLNKTALFLTVYHDDKQETL